MSDPNVGHSRIGASSMDRFVACPASVALCRKAEKRPSSVWANEGTCAHHLLELVLSSNTEAFHYEGMYLDIEGNLFEALNAQQLALLGQEVFEVVSDMIDAVDVAVAYVRSEKLAMEKRTGVPVEVFLEYRFHMQKFHPDLYGTSDVVLLARGFELLVLDYKHGAGKFVSVVKNKQARYYSLGVLYDLFEKYGRAAFPKKVIIAIAQPRCDSGQDDGGIRTEWYSVDDIWIDFKAYLLDAVAKTEQKDAEYRKNDSCRWCDGQLICPLWPKQVKETTGLDLFQEDSFVRSIQTLLESDEAVLRALQQESSIKGFFAGLKSYAYQRAIQGNPIPGTGLVQGSKHRVITNKQVVADKLLAEGYTEDQIFSKPALRTPAQLEKLPVAKGASFKPKTFISGQAVKPKGELSLVLTEGQSKPVTSIDHFADLDEDIAETEDPFTGFEDVFFGLDTEPETVDSVFDFL